MEEITYKGRRRERKEIDGDQEGEGTGEEMGLRTDQEHPIIRKWGMKKQQMKKEKGKSDDLGNNIASRMEQPTCQTFSKSQHWQGLLM
jgi:hypothetical protein